jgi:hypothetical protein
MSIRLTHAERELLRIAGELMDRLADADEPDVPSPGA